MALFAPVEALVALEAAGRLYEVRRKLEVFVVAVNEYSLSYINSVTAGPFIDHLEPVVVAAAVYLI